jgi:hypothetical protein
MGATCNAVVVVVLEEEEIGDVVVVGRKDGR